MRFAINSPVVIALPGVGAEWEREAGIEEIARVAVEADRRGYDYLTCSEHVALPPDTPSAMLGTSRGTVYWDPLPTFGYLSAVTRRIRLATSVLVLGYHHPLAIAKRYGTLDRISGGRLVLGVGVGTAEQEFAVLGAPFEDRGARADDAMRALRASLSRRIVEYEGEYYRYSGLVVEPHAVQERVPLWVGGRSRRALRRAIELGDGWMPGAIEPGLMRELLAHAPDRPEGFVVSARSPHALDPIGDRDGTSRIIEAMSAAGATTLEVRFVHTSLDEYLEQVEALASFDEFEPTR